MSKISFFVERDEVEFELMIHGEVSPVIPAKTNGLPENCHPAEGGELEIDRIVYRGHTWDGELTEKETEAVRLQFLEEQEDGLEYEPDFDDRDEVELDRDY